MDDTLARFGSAVAANWRYLADLGLLALVGLAAWTCKSIAQRRLGIFDYDKRDVAEIYRDLRSTALGWKPSDIGLPATDGAYGVVMDWAVPSGIATLTSFSSGEASLYFSTGGGVLGSGVAHESVRAAARAFVAEAAKRLPWMSPASEFPLPRIGWAYFHVLTGRGVFSTLARVEPVERNFEPAWGAAQQVITAIRESQPDAANPAEAGPT